MSGAADPVAGAAADAAAAGTLAELGDALVRRLAGHIGFDRFNIGLIDPVRHVFHDAYVHGRNVEGRSTGHRRTLDGTVVEAAMRAGGAFQFGAADRNAWVTRFPRFGPVYDSGIRSMLAVPMGSEGRTKASLVFASRDPDAYTPETVALAAAIGAAVALSFAGFDGMPASPPR
ncbi:MAG: GAF domain-containing protein [Alphaproteobacteria bacterium]